MASSSDDEYWYFAQGLDVNKITVPKLRSILVKHEVCYPSSAKKSELLALFRKFVTPQAEQLLREHAQVKRSTRGIEDYPSKSGKGERPGRTDLDVYDGPATPRWNHHHARAYTEAGSQLSNMSQVAIDEVVGEVLPVKGKEVRPHLEKRQQDPFSNPARQVGVRRIPVENVRVMKESRLVRSAVEGHRSNRERPSGKYGDRQGHAAPRHIGGTEFDDLEEEDAEDGDSEDGDSEDENSEDGDWDIE